MEKSQNVVQRIGEVERMISEGETLFRRAEAASKLGWYLLFLGTILLIFLGGGLKIIGLFVLGVGIWRAYSAEKYIREVEEGLKEYRGEKEELKASLFIKA